MDFIMTFAAVALVVLIACIIAYTYITNNIIRSQEKEIAKLHTEVFRLQAKCKRAHRSSPQVIEIHDNTIDPENVPKFGDI